MMITDVPLSLAETKDKPVPEWPQWALYQPYRSAISLYYTVLGNQLYELRATLHQETIDGVFDRTVLGELVDHLVGDLVPQSVTLIRLPATSEDERVIVQEATDVPDPIAHAASIRSSLPLLIRSATDDRTE